MKQADIFKKTGISRSSISRILAGERAPSWEAAKKLQKATKVHVSYWMESKNAPEKLNAQLIKRGFQDEGDEKLQTKAT